MCVFSVGLKFSKLSSAMPSEKGVSTEELPLSYLPVLHVGGDVFLIADGCRRAQATVGGGGMPSLGRWAWVL